MLQYSSCKNSQQESTRRNHLELQESEQAKWEHKHMMREDYQGLFYRKLNYIVMLEESQEAYNQREILMISHRENKYQKECYRARATQLDIHPVSFLAKEMVRRNEKFKKQLQMRKKQAQVRVQINKLQLDKKCLLEEIAIFANKLKDIAEEHYNEPMLIEAEQMLLEHGRKYNLLTSIASFVKSTKEITTNNMIYESLKNAIKRCNSQNGNALLRLQDLKLNYSQLKSKGELLDHINLYLKEFRSSTIFKELSEILNSYIGQYDQIDLHSHYLYKKLIEQIQGNVFLLSNINKELEKKGNDIKDYRIQIEILVEENKIAEQELRILQQKSAECIAEEAAYLSREYEQARIINQQEASSNEFRSPQTDYYSYFHQQLKQKYQQFIQNQLEDAEHIHILREKIEGQTIFLESLVEDLKEKQLSSTSELETHRSIQQSVYSEFSYTLRQNQSAKNIEQEPQVEQYFSKKSSRTHQLTDEIQLEESSNEQGSRKGSLLFCRLQSKKEKFLVKRLFKIRNGNKASHLNQHKDSQKVYEVNLTKKFLILQQTTPNSLRLNEKVEIDRIKGYKSDIGQHWISFDCGLNSLKLQFTTNNMPQFINKLQRLFRQLKMSKQNTFPKRY